MILKQASNNVLSHPFNPFPFTLYLHCYVNRIIPFIP